MSSFLRGEFLYFFKVGWLGLTFAIYNMTQHIGPKSLLGKVVPVLEKYLQNIYVRIYNCISMCNIGWSILTTTTTMLETQSGSGMRCTYAKIFLLLKDKFR